MSRKQNEKHATDRISTMENYISYFVSAKSIITTITSAWHSYYYRFRCWASVLPSVAEIQYCYSCSSKSALCRNSVFDGQHLSITACKTKCFLRTEGSSECINHWHRIVVMSQVITEPVAGFILSVRSLRINFVMFYFIFLKLFFTNVSYLPRGKCISIHATYK